APLDIWSEGRDLEMPQEETSATVVVPGTVTWYKRPQLALQIALDLGKDQGRTPEVFYAGRDDGTGAWEATQREAIRLGVRVTCAPLTRNQMITGLSSSMATIVPSELESLSLSLSEALVLSPQVIA